MQDSANGRVEGKVAMVTGGAAGIGQSCCETLSKHGAHVVIADLDEEKAASVANELGDSSMSLRLDVSQERDWDDGIQHVKERFGKLDILVNNAGYVQSASLLESSLEDYNRMMAVHAGGTFLGMKKTIPLMTKNGGGSIINMSSLSAKQGFPKFFAYTAAKGAILSMTRAAAIDCQNEDNRIRVNAVLPSGIATDLVKSVARADRDITPETTTGALPTGSWGLPEDVANLVLFLSSDESRFITGAEYILDNGLSIRPV